jgi:hypothetical protein
MTTRHASFVRRTLALAVAAAATGLAVVGAPPHDAGALPAGDSGYAQAQIRITADGTPRLVAGRHVSSRHGLSPDGFEVTREGTGHYRLLVADIIGDESAGGGTAHLVPWSKRSDDNPPICTIESWSQVTGGSSIDVLCFDGVTGVPRDGRRFDVWFSALDPLAVAEPGLTHLWADQASPAAPYTPDATYHVSGALAAEPTITRVSTGVYEVDFAENLDRSTPYVTAYGDSARWCNPARSVADGADGRRVRVVCFRNGGQPADSRFVLTMSSRDPWQGFASTAARLFVKRPGRAAMQQPAARNVNTEVGSGQNTHVRLGEGRQRVEMPRSRGNVPRAFVQASGASPRRCFVTGLVTSAADPSTGGVFTRCIDGETRQPVDTKQWVARHDQFLF